MGGCCSHTREDKVLCGPLFIILCELHSFLLSCFRRLIGAGMCCQHIHACERTQKKGGVIPPARRSLGLFITGVKATCHRFLDGVGASVYSCVGEENLNKDGCFPTHSASCHQPGRAVPLPSGGGPACVSISNRAAASITTPGGPS